MKLRKYKWLLSLTTIAAVLTPVAILSNNNTNGYQISKQSVKNNAGTETTSSIPKTLTESQVNALAPDPEDLYNEYAFASGYVIKDETSRIIYFYNWFKEEMWHVTITAIPNFPKQTIASMNVKGALTSTGAFDTKLFVYGNFAENKGSYLFELDMTSGALVANSLVTNITNSNAAETSTDAVATSTVQSTDNYLISDANLLTVIDQNTVIVTQKNVQHHSPNKGSHKDNQTNDNADNTFNFSEIKFNSNAAPTITTYKNVSIGASSSYTYGEILGVIYSNNQYVFAINALGAMNNNTKYALTVFEFYFKKTTTEVTEGQKAANAAGTLTATSFTETKPVGLNNTSNTSFDFMFFVNGINPSDVTGDSKTTGTTDITLKQEQDYLNDKCNNFSVKVAGTIEAPKMLISLNWDSTDLSVSTVGSPGSSVNTNYNDGANKILVSSLKGDGSTDPEFATYSLGTDSSKGMQNSLQYLGISNLIYTRDTNQSPFAVAVAYATSRGKTTIWFNFAKIDVNNMTNNSTTSSSNDNNASYLANSSSNYWFASDDQYSSSTSTDSSDIQTNKIKMDWYLNFIPNTDISGTDDSAANTNYVGYITTGKEDAKGNIDYYQNYFEIPGQITNQQEDSFVNNTKINLNDYQFTSVDSLLTDFKPTANTASTISPNSFATNDTLDAIINKLSTLPSDIVAYNVNVTPPSDDSQTTDTITTNELDASSAFSKVIITDDNAINGIFKVYQDTGVIEGVVSFKVKNYWNDGTTAIIRNVNLQLNKSSDFAIANDAVSTIANSNTDNTAIADYVEAKYPIATFTQNSADFKANFENFIKDSLSQLSSSDLGATLKQILLNSVQTAVKADQSVQPITTMSVSLQSDTPPTSTTTNSYKVGDYITVNPDTTNKTVTISYDLSKTGIPNAPTSPITLTYKNFSTDANPSSFAAYNDWVTQKQSAAQETPTPTPTTPTGGDNNTPQTPTTGDNNNPAQTPSSQNTKNNSAPIVLANWQIALIIIAIVIILAVTVGVLYWLKKRNENKYDY